MPYPVMNTLLDAGYPDGALNYWLSSFTAACQTRSSTPPSSGSPGALVR